MSNCGKCINTGWNKHMMAIIKMATINRTSESWTKFWNTAPYNFSLLQYHTAQKSGEKYSTVCTKASFIHYVTSEWHDHGTLQSQVQSSSGGQFLCGQKGPGLWGPCNFLVRQLLKTVACVSPTITSISYVNIWRMSTNVSMCMIKSEHNVYEFHLRTPAIWRDRKGKLKKPNGSGVCSLFTSCCETAAKSFHTFKSP